MRDDFPTNFEPGRMGPSGDFVGFVALLDVLLDDEYQAEYYHEIMMLTLRTDRFPETWEDTGNDPCYLDVRENGAPTVRHIGPDEHLVRPERENIWGHKPLESEEPTPNPRKKKHVKLKKERNPPRTTGKRSKLNVVPAERNAAAHEPPSKRSKFTHNRSAAEDDRAGRTPPRNQRQQPSANHPRATLKSMMQRRSLRSLYPLPLFSVL